MATRITVNGKTIVVEGDSSAVSIINGKVMVGGQIVEEGLSGIVAIKWEGPLANLKADGDVTCGDVAGDVRAGNNVTCGPVKGSVQAGNNVTAGSVGGSVTAGNNVNCRRG